MEASAPVVTDGPRQVTVGGQARTLARFRSYKVTLALDIISGVSDQVRELLRRVDEEKEKYAQANKVRITRTMCMERSSELKQAAVRVRKQADDDEAKPRPADESEEDAREWVEEIEALRSQADVLDARAEGWERQLRDMGDEQFVEYPGTMSQDEQMLVAVPEAMKMRKQFTQLLGLAMIPDAALEQAWITDDVFTVVEKHGQEILFECEVGEEIELIVAAREMLQDQMRPRMGALEKLRELRNWWSGTIDGTATEKGTENESEPTSSTPSLPSTDGQQDESSSTSPTETTSPSPVA